jgi:uncharacterized oligopeptide transporter (OPT) family protein
MPDESRKSPEEQDREWLEKVYQGDTPQLTVRAVLTGCLLGGLMALCNLYVGLKSGWGIGVDIAAIILGFAIWKSLTGLLPGIFKRDFNMMENTIMMTVAVAGSWISSAGLVSAVPALTMVSGRTFIWWQLMLWIGGILTLGLFMAIPLKRQMITVDQLRFPYNISVVETLRAMYSRGGEAMKKAKALGLAGLFGIIVATLRDGVGFLPSLWNVPMSFAGVRLSNLTISFEPGFIMMGIGALFGIKVGMSMLVGALLNYGVLAPYFINKDVIVHPAPVVRALEAPKFPLAMDYGGQLTFTLEEARITHEMAAGSRIDTLTYTWTRPASYAALPALLSDLNSQTLLDGSPNPLHPRIAFIDTLNKDLGASVLWARAPNSVHRETRLTLSPDTSSIAAGAPLGFRPGSSRLEAIGGFRNIVNWSMWSGAGLLVASGLLALAFQFKTMARTFSSFFTGFRRTKSNPSKDILEHIEIPGTWFVLGLVVAGIFCLLLQLFLFGIHWYMGIIAVLLTFFLAAVAARAGAEVGINPIGAMGKVTQLLYGVIAPGNMATNLMTANVTAGAACSCADTVGNLYVGYRVGAHPRKQFIAQVFGVLAGAMLAVPAYFILVPDANALGGAKFPAPSAIVWAGVARILSQGLHTIPISARYAMLISIILAVVIVTLERIFPKIRPYTPSCTALGIALTIPAYNSIMMFLGSFFVWVIEKRAPQTGETYSIPVASGAIAGESLTGVTIAALMAAGVLG